jgi:hypothetical protein
VAGIGGNKADGGYIDTYSGNYFFAKNRYIDMGVSIPAIKITSLTMSALGWGATGSLMAVDLYVSNDGVNWTFLGSPNASGLTPGTITVTGTQLASLGVSAVRYFRSHNNSCNDALDVTITYQS